MPSDNTTTIRTIKCKECDRTISYRLEEEVYGFASGISSTVTQEGVEVKGIYLECEGHHVNLYYVAVR
jgi:hypothetical protein